MSYDRSTWVNRGNRAERSQAEEMRDHERVKFLRALDKAAFEVTDWEAEFIDSTFKRIADTDGVRVIIFSPKQRVAIDEMQAKYGGRL